MPVPITMQARKNTLDKFLSKKCNQSHDICKVIQNNITTLLHGNDTILGKYIDRYIDRYIEFFAKRGVCSPCYFKEKRCTEINLNILIELFSTVCPSDQAINTVLNYFYESEAYQIISTICTNSWKKLSNKIITKIIDSPYFPIILEKFNDPEIPINSYIARKIVSVNMDTYYYCPVTLADSEKMMLTDKKENDDSNYYTDSDADSDTDTYPETHSDSDSDSNPEYPITIQKHLELRQNIVQHIIIKRIINANFGGDRLSLFW